MCVIVGLRWEECEQRFDADIKNFELNQIYFFLPVLQNIAQKLSPFLLAKDEAHLKLVSCFVQFIFLELYAVYNFISLICHQFTKNVSKIIPQGYIVLVTECDEPKPLDELLVCHFCGFFI